MKTRRRAALATTLVLLLGLGVFWHGTDGFTAWTAETARRAAILRSPRALPLVTLQDQDGRAFRLQDYQGQLLAVEFMYTRCQTICQAQGLLFSQLREQIPAPMRGRAFSLLSISFDPEHDDPPRLAAWAERFGADGASWRVARVPDRAELARLLQAFGIVVIDDGMGGFEHNAALHLLDRTGRLRLINDLDTADTFVAQAVALQ